MLWAESWHPNPKPYLQPHAQAAFQQQAIHQALVVGSRLVAREDAHLRVDLPLRRRLPPLQGLEHTLGFLGFKVQGFENHSNWALRRSSRAQTLDIPREAE